ncbi:Cell division protein FtsI [Peptidoglycan synthetase] [[Actinomadura] parvosata subsp. kistnae]|uniref:penicillin-binding transpeptidase domain-containing protein n=1 Tax=[Actinomadura] parvosata TaxID=1955412 RepID=UPI0009AC35CB|nr:penicillin-binding transpeptidase domain-containing protein [Nonomuraea sp. ATCC 55076]SPL92200.1 Cell division protein FtsI [Peptidoglycan synthetase] [Actinomadura parvosata subsp. kistnae]
MAGSRGRWLDVPLGRVAKLCAVLLFALLTHVTLVQAFGSHALNADHRNERALIDRYGRPRGDIRTYDGTPIATSLPATGGPYRYRRAYPRGAEYAAVTGHVSLHRSTGLEQAQDAVLSGEDPKVKVRSLVGEGAVEGADLRLTIRDRVQRAAYQGLRNAGIPGAVVALDPATGAVLGLATYPTYDPNALATFDRGLLAQTARKLRQEPAQPLLNRALNRLYPPGSTFKLVTAAAALASGEYTPAAIVPAPARLRLPGAPAYLQAGARCGSGRPTLAYAFQASCDTAFAAIGMQLGQDLLRDQAEAFGFNQAALRIPLLATPSRFPSVADRDQLALTAIGHHGNRVTPLMVAMLSAAVANNGVLMRPYLVEEARLPDGAVINRASPVAYRTAVAPVLARYLAAMMTSVAPASGTGAGVPGVRMAAKTAASGDVPGENAVITAFAPAEAPEVAVGVVLERPGQRVDAVATIARAVIEAALS